MANLSSYLPDGIDESSVAITGGTINGTTIGASTAAAGTFTTLLAAQSGAGSEALAVGSNAGASSQGLQATAVGRYAGNASQGAYAAAFGDRAGQTTQGASAIAVGTEAGKTSQGDYSIAIGREAGKTSQSDYGVAIGGYTARTSQGERAVAIGNYAGDTSQGDYCVALGYKSGETSQAYGAVGLGDQAGRTRQGQYSVAVGRYAGRTDQGDNGIIISSVGSTIDNTSSDHIQIQSASTKYLLYNGSNNWTFSGGSLYVGSSLVSSSDQALKGNIITAPSDMIGKLTGREWNWKSNGEKGSGVVAQEIEEHLPHLVSKNDEGIKGVNYSGLTGYLIEAIKEQKAMIETLQAEVAELKGS